MAGYTRQSVASIINGSDITAPPLNAEFNQILAAFDGSTGHSHDGSTGNAPKINLATSLSGYLPAVHGGVGGKNKLDATAAPTTADDNSEGFAPGSIWENTTNGRVYICVGNAANAAVWRELVTIFTNNKIEPFAHNTVDLGSPTVRFQDLFLQGAASIVGNTSVGGALAVTGNTNLSNVSASGTLSITGDTSLSNVVASGNVSVSGTFTNLGGATIGDNGSGNLVVNSTTDLNGPVFLGNSASDLVHLTGNINSHIKPNNSGQWDLGSTSNKWNSLFLETLLSSDMLDVRSATADDLLVQNGATLNTLTTSGNVSISGTTSLNSSLTVAGNTNLNGNVFVGNSSSDIIGFTSRIGSDFVPDTTGTTKNLGLPTAKWNNLYLSGSANTAGLIVDGTTTLLGNISVSGTFSSVPSTGTISSTSLVTAPNIETDNLTARGGTINSTAIGNTTPSTIVGTTVQATTGFTGDLAGNVVGNVTGNLTGNVIGNVAGNVTASSGTSTFTDVTINGTLNMNGATTATITNLSAPVNPNDAARKADVDNAVSGLLDGAPAALDTLNELAAALNDDANAYTNLNNSIQARVQKGGDIMTGPLDMGSNYVLSTSAPLVNQHLANKAYVDSTTLSSSGGTVTGAIDMGANFISSTSAPTANAHLTNKQYVDGILGSATAAATSASNAATSESNASTSAANAATSATEAAASATSAAQSLDTFDDIFLGAKTAAPTVDNDGDALQEGAIYFNTTDDNMYVYRSNLWRAFDNVNQQVISNYTFTAISGQISFNTTDDNGATVSINTSAVTVYLNGVKLVPTVDYTAYTQAIVLTEAALAGDVLEVVTYEKFSAVQHIAFDQLTGVDLVSTTSGSTNYIHVLGIDNNGDVVSQGHNTTDRKILSAGSGVQMGQWTFDDTDSGDTALRVKFGSTTVMKLYSNGDVEFAGNVTANATIT